MTDNRTVIVLQAAEVQRVVQIVMDRDAAAALEFVKAVLRPQVEAALGPKHCRPVFELPSSESRPLGPPPAPGKPADEGREGT